MDSQVDTTSCALADARQPSLEALGVFPWSEDLLSSWLKGEPASQGIDQWIYWNNSPLRHAAPAALAPLFPTSFYEKFMEDPRVSTSVDATLRTRLSWTSSVCWAPNDPLSEIAMTTPGRLKRLALLGVSFSLRHEITQVIDGAIVRQLRAQVGEDILQVVLLSGDASKYFIEPMNEELSSFNTIVERLEQGALKLVQHAFSSKERGIQERVATKLPGCFAGGYYEAPLPWALQAEQLMNTLWKEAGSWL